MMPDATRNLRDIAARLPCLEDRPAIAGVGNELRADDAFGVMIARSLAGRVAVPVFDTGTVPENYLGKVVQAGAKHLIVVDVVDFRGDGGEIRLFGPEELEVCHITTHLPAYELAQFFLNVGGVQMLILAAQPVTLQLAGDMSPAVRKAADTVTGMLEDLYGKPEEQG